MWDCPACGCQAIAHDLASCPMCGKERQMPKISAQDGPSNRWEEPDQADTQGAPQTAQEPAGEQQGPEPAAESGKDALSELEAAAAALKRPSRAKAE